MESRLDWLQRRLGLDDMGLRKMVLRLPSLLGYSVEDNMEPKLEWLQTRLDLDDAELRKKVVLLQRRGPKLESAQGTAEEGGSGIPSVLQRRGQHGAEARLAADAPRPGRRAAEEDCSDASVTA